MVVLVRDTSQPENKGWSACQPQVPGERPGEVFLLDTVMQFTFPGKEILHSASDIMCGPIALLTAVWNGCCHSLDEYFGRCFVVRSFYGKCTTQLVRSEYYF